VNVADFDISECRPIPEQPDLVDFLLVVDILWKYDMSNGNAWFQEYKWLEKYGMDGGACVFS